MTKRFSRCGWMLLIPFLASCAAPRLPGVNEAMLKAVDDGEVSGAVTVVATKDKVLHCAATGWANLEGKQPMRTDTLFWIASMTKPVTAVAVLMLQDEGKLNVADPVAKYLPEFAGLKTPSGQPANLTIAQLLTHTSGLGEAPSEAAAQARSLADSHPLVPGCPDAVRAGQPMALHPIRHQCGGPDCRGRQRQAV